MFISHKLLRTFIVKAIGLQSVYVKDQIVNITGFEDHRVMLQLLSCAVVVESSHRQYANVGPAVFQQMFFMDMEI